VLAATLSGLAVFAVVILLQRIIYNDWLHRAGIRIVGAVVSGLLTGAFVYRWQCAVRERRVEMLRRFETILQMNDRIRNALQIIECATYASNPEATEPVRNAVDVIEGVLHEVLSDAHPSLPAAGDKSAEAPR
jgi:hypothetical protein